MTNKKKTRVTLAEVQNMKGKTQWAKLIADDKNMNKKSTSSKNTSTIISPCS
ncbi:hypothetical protein MAH1_27550 [Sessilibacter sp. MAH1]